MRIPFNKPYATGNEFGYIQEAIDSMHLSGDGQFTKRCNQWLKVHCATPKALLTHSCTAALEMAAILLDIQPDDEVILPSFTFVSSANAFVLRGAKVVFVDIRPDTLNIDETLVSEAITPKTKAICAVHYAGVGCEMDALSKTAEENKIALIEDAAQGLMSTYKGTPLGSIGALGCVSFHETKNVISGEGGALLINKPEYYERAEIIREKGTNRSAFFRGEVDKYTWVDIGSSFLPSELVAAFLWAQLEKAEIITQQRLALWQRYWDAFESAEQQGLVRRPYIPADCSHNAHMFYLLFESLEVRTKVIRALKDKGLHAVFHYVPLHSSPAGLRFGRTVGALPHTQRTSDTLLRLPLWVGLTESIVDEIAEVVIRAVREGLQMGSLVIGANGFLGAKLCRRLLEQKESLTAVVNKNRESVPQGAKVVPIESVQSISDEVDTIYFVAAFIPYGAMDVPNPRLFLDNVLTVQRVCAQWPKARLIFASSTAVYGKNSHLPINEESGFFEPTLYGQSKIAAEFIARMHQSFAIIRFSSLCGMGMAENTFVPRVISQATREKQITLYGTGSRLQDYLHVEDAVDACLIAAQNNQNGILMGVSGRSVSNQDLAMVVATKTGALIQYVGADTSPDSVYDTSTTAKEWGFAPKRTVMDAVEELLHE